MNDELCDLSELANALLSDPTGMQEGVERVLTARVNERTRRRLLLLGQIRDNMEPPLNKEHTAIVYGYNYLRQNVILMPSEEFNERVRLLVRANFESLRPLKNVYVDDWLDEMGVSDGDTRAQVADLLLKRGPLADASPKERLDVFYKLVGREELHAWKVRLQENLPFAKVVWVEWRNPYKGEHFATVNL